MSFMQETFNRDFRVALTRVGAFLVVVYGVGVVFSKISK